MELGNCGFENLKIENVKNMIIGKILMPSTSCSYRFLPRWAPENDKKWLSKRFKILDINFISIKKHGMEIW